MQTLACQISSSLMQLLLSFRGRTNEKTFVQTLPCHLSSILISFFLSLDQDTRVEKSLMQTLACQLSPILMHSCSRFGGRGLIKLSCKFSLVNPNQLSCNSCSRLTRTRVLRKLSCKLSLVNSSITLMRLFFSFDHGTTVEKSLMQILISHQLSCDFWPKPACNPDFNNSTGKGQLIHVLHVF